MSELHSNEFDFHSKENSLVIPKHTLQDQRNERKDDF